MKTTKYLWMLFLTLAGLNLAACSDDDDEGSQSAPMTISHVYLQDVKSSQPDREVSFARLGQLLRIEGSGFKGLKKIYVNGYDTYFNNALLTDNNVWVTLNAKTPIAQAEAKYRNTIRFVKDQTETTYEFSIRAAMPTITGCEATVVAPGQEVVVYGTNLQEIIKVTLPGGVVVEGTDNITSDPDGEWFSFTMPSGVGSGAIQAEGANGTAISGSYFNNTDCFIIDFDNLGVLGSWGQTYGQDDLVDDPANSGRGKVVQLIPQSVLDEGGIDAGKRTLLWATAGDEEPTTNWTRMLQYIPGTTPVSDVALQFDVLVPGQWNLSGQLEFSLQNNLFNYGYGSAETTPGGSHDAYVWVPWLNEDGTATPYTTGGKWRTITIPLNKFGVFSDADNASTFQDVVNEHMSGTYWNFVFLFVNNDLKVNDDLTYEARLAQDLIYVDNLRIVSTAAPTTSDFPEDEE